jgi:hypothetical protein
MGSTSIAFESLYAVNAGNIHIIDNTGYGSSVQLTWCTGGLNFNGYQSLGTSFGELSYVPSTGILTAVGFSGTLAAITAGGTADAITATYSPALTALTNLTLCCVVPGADNATTTPTFAPNGLTAHTITKHGGAALVAGDIKNLGPALLVYNSANTRWELLNPASAPALPAATTHQYLTSGTSATYTTPANCRAIHVEMVGGGGGGSGSGSSPGAGGNGGDTIFNTIHAKGGSGAAVATGNTSPVGAGGSGGSGSATLRIDGGDGGGGNDSSSTNPNGPGGAGGMGVFGGGGLGMLVAAGKAGKANTGGGGGGGGTGANASTSGGGGGGAGEYVILDITSPASTYTYTVGAGGSAGTVGGGSNPFAGAAGGTGFIRVTEYY